MNSQSVTGLHLEVECLRSRTDIKDRKMNKKGFSRPRLSPNEAKRIKRICTDVLSGDVQAQQRFYDWLEKVAPRMGGGEGIAHWLDTLALEDLGFDGCALFYETMMLLAPKEQQEGFMRKHSSDMEPHLTRAGFVLGKDFSFGSAGQLLPSRRVVEFIKGYLPPTYWDRLEQKAQRDLLRG
jgi:hypothetical protein